MRASDAIGRHSGLKHRTVWVRFPPCPLRDNMKKGLALYEALLIFVILGMVALVVFMAIIQEKEENIMNKVLRVTFSDGKVFDVPAEFIAKARAKYYAQTDADRGEDYTKVYNEELKAGLADDSEITDWAFNNMDWSDVKEQAVLVEQETKDDVDREKEWPNVEHNVIIK